MSKFNKGFSRALEVGKLVEQALPKTLSLGFMFPETKQDPNHQCKDWYVIEGYQNGRENGIIIWLFGAKWKETAFYVCQARRTDDLGYYKGRFAMQGLSQEAYENPCFGDWSVEDVAEKIILEIRTIIGIGI